MFFILELKLKFFLNMDWHDNSKKTEPDSGLSDEHGSIDIPSMDSFFF